MAGTFEGSKGIVKWAANIKTRLANDSTRHAFKELVQVQGFLFLEEYLEEVQRGPTQSAVVEIAKTPGRKKDLPKKTRAAVAAASARKLRIASSNDKENQVPANTAVTLQQALLNAQKDKANGMDDNDDRIQPSPKKRNPLTVSIVVPSQSEGHSPAPPQQTPAAHHLPIAEPTPQSLPSITEREEEADRRAVSPPLATPAKENVSEPDVPVAASAKNTADEPIPATPLQSAVTARASGKVAPSQIPTPKPISTAEPTVRPSTPIRSPVTRATSPLARATSPLASRLGSSINGPRSPSPTKVMKGTPGSPAFVTRIPRSPKLGFQVGSAPLPNPPRSPLALRKDLALSGPEVTNFSSVGTSNPAASIRPSNAGEGALPPAPKVRSSFLQRQPHDGPSLLGGGKKSMGGALVAKKSVAGAGALLTSTAGSTVTKWKADLELVESAEKGFKPTKSTYERESVAVLQRKRKSEVDDEENSGHAMRKSKILKSSHGAPSRAAAQEFDSDDDEYEGDEFMKLRETVGNLKRQKSLHLVDIDITTRLNVKIPPPPAAVESASPIAPSRGSTGAESCTATQPAAERHSRSHERLSISELMSSTEQRKAEVVQAPLSGKDSQPSSKAAKAAAVALAKKEFTLLMASSNTSTTPPNSPPPSSLPPAAPQPPAKDSASGIKPSAPRPAANATLSQWEATMLGVKPNPTAAPMAEPTPSAAPVSLKVNPSSPIAAHALASKPFSKEAAVTKPASAARNFTEIPADLFMGPSRDAQLQPPAPVPATRQSSVTTISTQASYTDSIFSTQGSHGVADTQPTDYGLSQEVLPIPVEVKAKAKPEQPAAPPAPKPFIRPDSAMDEDSRASTPAFSSDDAGSSQSDLGAGGSAGLFAYASHFVSKAFGAGSAKKPPKADGPIKVFENAAAAKKEQEEKEKKKVERKEVMEARRLAVSQKKQEEDRARQLEHEKKVKEEIERRKREREEMNASKLGAKAKKMDEPEAKKRKITAEVERKPELKKQPSKDKLNTSFQAAGSSGLPRFNAARPPQQVAQPSSQPVGKTLVKKPSGNLGSTSNPYTQSAMRGPSFGKLPPVGASKTFGNVHTSEAGPSKPTKTFTGPVKGKAPEFNAPPALKSAAGKARPPPAMQIALKNVVASEDIVLEEPNSEYSDSEDEGRNKGRPSWTQSPNLRQALEEQAQFNPDLIFGPIPQLDMGEMFPQRKFRPRSSSANWEGHALSKEEQVKYNEKMGYMGNIAE